MNIKAPLIPMEDFFRNPEKSSFQISPSGDHVAFMSTLENKNECICNGDENKKREEANCL